MSQSYRMMIQLRYYNHHYINAIEQACMNEWDFYEWEHESNPDVILAEGEDFLYGGESAEEFAARLTRKVWIANKAYCEVHVNSIYLDERPSISHMLDKHDYNEFIISMAEEPVPVAKVIDPNEECACGMRRSACDYHKR